MDQDGPRRPTPGSPPITPPRRTVAVGPQFEHPCFYFILSARIVHSVSYYSSPPPIVHGRDATNETLITSVISQKKRK